MRTALKTDDPDGSGLKWGDWMKATPLATEKHVLWPDEVGIYTGRMGSQIYVVKKGEKSARLYPGDYWEKQDD